jgi:hypothetical protein
MRDEEFYEFIRTLAVTSGLPSILPVCETPVACRAPTRTARPHLTPIAVGEVFENPVTRERSVRLHVSRRG